MLPKKHRLTRTKDFNEVYKNSTPLYSPSLVLRYEKVGKKKDSRFGFVVSNKIFKKNTARNLLKRRLRAIIKNKLKQIFPGFDFIITARARIRGRSYQQIERDLEGLLKRAKTLDKI